MKIESIENIKNIENENLQHYDSAVNDINIIICLKLLVKAYRIYMPDSSCIIKGFLILIPLTIISYKVLLLQKKRHKII